MIYYHSTKHFKSIITFLEAHRNRNTERILLGKSILVWKVKDTFKAAFDIDNYENFVRVQSDAAVRKLASLYPYDNFQDDGAEEEIRAAMVSNLRVILCSDKKSHPY